MNQDLSIAVLASTIIIAIQYHNCTVIPEISKKCNYTKKYNVYKSIPYSNTIS